MAQLTQDQIDQLIEQNKQLMATLQGMATTTGNQGAENTIATITKVEDTVQQHLPLIEHVAKEVVDWLKGLGKHKDKAHVDALKMSLHTQVQNGQVHSQGKTGEDLTNAINKAVDNAVQAA